MSVEFYEKNADTFIAQTVDVDMTGLYQRFCKHLHSGASVLDAGCGSGRDALAFSSMGYDVVAFDASAKMVATASKRSCCPVYKMTFENMELGREFDGIWACASLLHVPRPQLPEILKRLMDILKPTGALYASFKYGDQEREKDGRYFNDMDDAQLERIISFLPMVHLEEIWTTADQRPNRRSEMWLNMILTLRSENKIR